MNGRMHRLLMVMCVLVMGAIMYFAFARVNPLPATDAGGGFNPVFLLLLLCPLLHLFMMRGHGASCHKQEQGDNKADCHEKKGS